MDYRTEHEAWLEVCDALLEAKAVTQEDLNSSTLRDDTAGCKLLIKIRVWGNELALLRASEDSDSR